MTPMCSEHAALLKCIVKKQKYDQTARLVYADWLEERDDPGYLIFRYYQPETWILMVDPETTMY